MKKKIVIIVCVVILIAAGLFLAFHNGIINPTENKIPGVTSGKIDAVAYRMKLDLDVNAKTLTEAVEMEIRNDTSAPVEEVIIRDMTPSIHAYNKQYYDNDTQTSAIIGITSNEQPLAYSVKKESIVRVKLNEALKPQETTTVTVDMKTDIPDRQDRFGYVERKDGTIFALSFCFPYLADNKNGEWVLHPYFDDGESRSYDIADYDIELRHPKGYTVIATGTEETRDGVTKITARNVRDMAIVVSDMMHKDTFEVKGITINNYYLDSQYTATYRKLTELVIKDAIRVFTDTIGAYPYEELDVTPLLFGFGYGGMEYPGLVMTNATSFYDGTMMDAWSLSDGLSHEIGHEWFYAAVGNDEYAEGWIDEGFTTYLERELFGLYDGDAQNYLLQIDDMAPTVEGRIASRDELMQTARQDYRGKYLNTSPDRYTKDQSYGEIEYEESYLFLQEIRSAMGDETFNAFLKDLYGRYCLKEADSDDVIACIREYDDSEAVNEILRFYFR